MATDGPGLMQGDDASSFCYMVYNTINERGMLSIDSLIERIYKGEISRRNEYMRLLGEFIDVACNGSIKKEMWSCYGVKDDPNSYIYNKLKALAASRQALIEVLRKSTQWLLEYIDPVLAYQAGWGDIGVNHQQHLVLLGFVRGLDKYTDQYESENKVITQFLAKLSKEEVYTIKAAQKHREQVIAMYDKLKMIGCSRATSDAFDEMLRHGWFKEEDYQNAVNHLTSNINTIKRLLQDQQSGYVIYQRDDPQVRLRNPLAERGLAKTIQETKDILWDHEIIPRAEFKKLMQAGTVKPSNMYISGGRLYELRPSKIVEMYFNDLMDIYFNQLVQYSFVSEWRVRHEMSEVNEPNNTFISHFMGQLKYGSIFDNLNRRENNREYLRNKYPDLFNLIVDNSQEKRAEIQKEFFKQLKIKMGHDKPCIVLTVSHPRPNDDYQLYFCITTMSEFCKSSRLQNECIKLIEL